MIRKDVEKKKRHQNIAIAIAIAIEIYTDLVFLCLKFMYYDLFFYKLDNTEYCMRPYL